MTIQWAQGNQNVQIHDVRGTIQVSFGSERRLVPLERAVVPIGQQVRSPARLVRARSGVVPYAARVGLRDDLERWVGVADAFAGCVIGGRGGSGKTRLGVELCETATQAHWLCGLLAQRADHAALDALVQTPIPRLVVVDYAESRVEQLEVVVPLLCAHASVEHPVRLLLLVRAAPRRGDDWTEQLRNQSDALDSALDEMDVRVLENMPLEPAERRSLFQAAACSFAARVQPAVAVPDAPGLLSESIFINPLLVVIAAYLAVHGDADLPATKAELLDELLQHEDRYWKASAKDLDTDPAMRQRIVALATLAGAASEREAIELLRLAPDLADASAERRGRLARWAHELYPGPAWWNPLEPDLVGEHLVAISYTDHPEILAGALARESAEAVAQPLDVYTRAANDHPALARALGAVLTRELERLCIVAVAQVASEPNLDLLLGGSTVAAALSQAVSAIEVEPDALTSALNHLPPRPDVVLSPLGAALGSQLVRHLRQLASIDHATHDPELASALNNLSVSLAETGRYDEALSAGHEVVSAYRGLTATAPVTYTPDLATGLNNLSNRLRESEQYDEALVASQEAVELRRHLATASPKIYEPMLATTLSNLSVHLADVKRHDEALAAIQEAVDLGRRAAAADPATHGPNLAKTLGNLSNRLVVCDRKDEALVAVQECASVFRRLAIAIPAAYEPDLAKALNNLSNGLGSAGRHDEAIEASREAVDLIRRLATANPAAYLASFARALHNLATHLANSGQPDEAARAQMEADSLGR